LLIFGVADFGRLPTTPSLASVYFNRTAPIERPDMGYAAISLASMTIVKVIAVQIAGLAAGIG
jgi:hypothetical protein